MKKTSPDLPEICSPNISHSNHKDESFNFSFTECSILLFVPREKWKEDSEVTHCFNCNSIFLFFLRRKHHCRKCGNIFCDNCSNNFLNTAEIGMNHPEKIVRLCDYCFKGTQNYMNLLRREKFLHNRALFQKNNDITLEQESYSSDSVEEDPPRRISDNNGNNDNLEEKLRFLQEKLKEVLDIMTVRIPVFSQEPLREKVLKVLSEALSTVYLDSINHHDFMDICHYVKIKKLGFHEQSSPDLRYIQGIICRKNVSDRKMKSSFEKPSILLISPSIDLPTLTEKRENDGPVNMELLLQNERKMMKKIVEVLMRFKPNVIFLENSINRIAADLFKSQGITIFLKVKGHLIRRIARMTKGRILKSLRNLEKSNLKNITGNCERLFTRRRPVESDPNLATRDPTLLYLEGCNPEFGGTIELTGPSLDELAAMKKALKVLLRLGRHVVLEHEVVSLEGRLREELKKMCPETSPIAVLRIKSSYDLTDIRPEAFNNFSMMNQELGLVSCNEPREGDFSTFLDQKIGMIRFAKRDFIQYTKIHLVSAIIENSIDIVNNPAALAEVAAMKTPLLELCGQPSSNKICFYSQDDISLGTFILNKVKNLFTKCERDGCCRPRYNHISSYFQGNRFVKISVEITGFVRQAALNPEGKYVILEESKTIQDRLSSSNSGKFEGNFSPNGNKPEISLSNFKTCIACESCGAKLTEEKHLEHGYLEYSFTRFLSHFFVAGGGRKPKLGETTNENESIVKKCPHTHRKRVFQYGEFMINFTSGVAKTFRLDFRRISNKTSLSLVQEASDIILQRKRELYLKTFKSVLTALINLVKQLLKMSVAEIEPNGLNTLLESFLNSVQIFVLSVESTLNGEFDCYLDIEFERLSLSQQFSGFLEVFFAVYLKKPDFIAKLKEFISNNLMRSDESLETRERWKKRGRDFSPSLRTTYPLFKRSLSSNKNFDQSPSRQFTQPSPAKIKDHRFSSNSRVRGEKDEYEKLGFFKKASRYSERNFEKSEFSNSKAEDSGSEKEDVINEKFEADFELAETELKLENSPIEDHENDNVSPQLTLEVETLNGKKNCLAGDLEEIFKECRMLNSGIDHKFMDAMATKQFQNPILEVSRLQKYKYIPIYENEPLSAVAHAMNSPEYLKEVYIEGGFLKHEQEIGIMKLSNDTTGSFKQFIQSHLEKSSKKLEVPSHFVFRTSLVKPFILQSELKKIAIEETPGLKNEEQGFLIRKRKLISVSIIAYYAKQFEALRMDNGILLSSFLKSLGCSSQWNENSGGKSKASFIKSFDNLYIFKELEKKEFSMFFNYSGSYFDYLWKSNNKKKPSVLTKLLGLFEVKVKNSRYYYIAMENLFFGMENSADLQIYDLKGSDTNRYAEKKKKNQTLLDTNFKIDQNGEPLSLKLEDRKYLEIAFENDSRFLKKHDLVDYSLLVIIDREKPLVRMGIIDYLREYTWDKKMETVAKKISKGGATPTIVNPGEYRDRFKKAMNRYFMEMHG